MDSNSDLGAVSAERFSNLCSYYKSEFEIFNNKLILGTPLYSYLVRLKMHAKAEQFLKDEGAPQELVNAFFFTKQSSKRAFSLSKKLLKLAREYPEYLWLSAEMSDVAGRVVENIPGVPLLSSSGGTNWEARWAAETAAIVCRVNTPHTLTFGRDAIVPSQPTGRFCKTVQSALAVSEIEAHWDSPAEWVHKNFDRKRLFCRLDTVAGK